MLDFEHFALSNFDNSAREQARAATVKWLKADPTNLDFWVDGEDRLVMSGDFKERRSRGGAMPNLTASSVS